MSYASLEEALQSVGNPVDLLRNSQIGPYAFPVVRHEFTNWRDEQRAWRETCALFDQSHHMTDLYVEGPDALKLFTDLGVNTFHNFKVDQAKQFVAKLDRCRHWLDVGAIPSPTVSTLLKKSGIEHRQLRLPKPGKPKPVAAETPKKEAAAAEPAAS